MNRLSLTFYTPIPVILIMTERDYAIRSFKEITLNASQHTEERMDLYYEKMKALMNNYQDLILENQMVLDELEQECQEKINENMAYALQYMDAYDYRMNLGKLARLIPSSSIISISVIFLCLQKQP